MSSEEFQTDHDAIITLIAEFRGFREQVTADIKEIKDNTKATLNDHEQRIRFLEDTTVGKSYYDTNHQQLVIQVAKLSRYIYIAVGGLMAFQILLDIYFKIR